jgi:hypothetical protein
MLRPDKRFLTGVAEANPSPNRRHLIDSRCSMKILMVLTSHDQLGNTGKKTGFWLEEFAAPYYAFKDAGVDVTLVSPAGGQPPLDPKSDEPGAQTAETDRFRNDSAAQQALANTGRLADVSADDFDAVFYPGGHGPLWDLAEDKHSIALIEAFDRATNPTVLSATRRVYCVTPSPLTANRWLQHRAGHRFHQFRRSRRRPDGRGAVPDRRRVPASRRLLLESC